MTAPNNIMLIDDDEIFTFIIKKIIDETKLSGQINIFNNGQAAIDFLKEAAEKTSLLPEIIFLDLSMPVLDGWGFLDEYIHLKSKFAKKMTLYIISTSVSPMDFEKAKNYSDVTDFIVKPMAKERFIEIIKELSKAES
ncbi:response regulator [Flavobacterium sp. XGLA_31]|uniref:response regulator n=1 Tax=Flavobacterium sp. XGLA_31 TaxID=3447666 RepID=UPI003F3B0721